MKTNQPNKQNAVCSSLEPDPSIHIVVGSGKLVLSMVPMTLKGEMSFSVIESH